MAACSRELYWYYYIAGSLITFIGGLLILIPARLCWYSIHHKNKSNDYGSWKSRRQNFNFFSRMRAHAAHIVSGHTIASKAAIVFVWLVNMASIILYLIEATLFNVADCGPVIGDVSQYVWLAFSCVFVVNYVIRITAAPDKCYMWIDLYSIVDHFTIIPLYVGVYFNSNWLGLRFLRLLYLLQLPDILQLTHITKSKQAIRLIQAVSIFTSIWLVSSGFVHISENNGDPHHNYSNAQSLTYWDCVYWLLVTMSTVGFGEITPTTDIGRAFIIVFIMGSFAMFTSLIPELAASLGRTQKYHKPYKRIYGKKHIVVCGYITINTVSNFIKNFLHEDANSGDVDVVFVDRQKPGLEMEAFFKRHFNDVKFVQGTVMDIKTLEGVKIRYADACLILADRGSNDPDGEDAANIMRATAVKNYNPQIRVIVQLLQFRSKMNILHIPNWDWDKGDEVICISELKNGILAQNCLSPGICTLLSNLFTMRSSKQTLSTAWSDLYEYGASNEIYAEHFSSSFDGLSFEKAVAICFSQLGILLLAIHVQEKAQNGRRQLKVNPINHIISSDTIGFFIAQSPEEVKKVTTYMGTIDGLSVASSPTSKMNGRPSCSSDHDEKAELEPIMSRRMSVSSVEDSYLEYLETIGGRLAHYKNSQKSMKLPRSISKDDQEQLDITGMVHWNEMKSLEECTLHFEKIITSIFRDHVIVCLNADENSPECGLVNLISPLRSSCLKYQELKDIIIVGKLEAVSKEWNDLANFPKLYVLPQTRDRRTDLRSASIQYCSMCVIMTAGGHIKVDETLLDKEAVLTTLAIKSMFGTRMENRIKVVGVLTNPESFRRDMSVGCEIPIITELEHDCNVAYVDPDDDDDPSVPLYMTMPYACGQVFIGSVLDSLVSCTYLNGDVLTLVRALVTGGETAEFEKIIAKGLGIVRRNTLIDISSARKKCRLGQMSLSCGPLEKLQHENKYGTLFIQALETYKLICLGLYRLMDPESPDPRNRSRVVICNPNYNLQLLISDRVFVLQPFEMSYGHPSSSSPFSPPSPTAEDDEEFSHSGVYFSFDGEHAPQSSQL